MAALEREIEKKRRRHLLQATIPAISFTKPFHIPLATRKAQKTTITRSSPTIMTAN
jgi:hypothetical protein